MRRSRINKNFLHPTRSMGAELELRLNFSAENLRIFFSIFLNIFCSHWKPNEEIQQIFVQNHKLGKIPLIFLVNPNIFNFFLKIIENLSCLWKIAQFLQRKKLDQAICIWICAKILNFNSRNFYWFQLSNIFI